MFLLNAVALALSVVSTAAQLPPTFDLFALDSQTLSQVGCVTAYGNLTTNTLKCYPFRSRPVSTTESEILVVGTPCTVGDTFTCFGQGGDDEVGHFTSDGGYLSTEEHGTEFSVDSLDDTGVDSVGMPIGVTLRVGWVGSCNLFLAIHPVGG